MAKRISDMQRIINYGLDASAEGLQSAIEALQVIKANRYPKVAKVPRKPRSDAGKSRRTAQSPPPAASVTEPSSSES